MRRSLLKQAVSCLSILFLVYPPGQALASEAALSGCPAQLLAPEGNGFARRRVGELRQALISARGRLRTHLAEPVHRDQIALQQELVSTLQEEIGQYRAQIRHALMEERAARTEERVLLAEAKTTEEIARFRSALNAAQQAYEEARFCPVTGLSSWMGREMTCVALQWEKALLHLQRVLTPFGIAVFNETVGLDSQGVAAAQSAREDIDKQIEETRSRLLGARNTNDTSLEKGLELQLKVLQLRRLTEPYLAGTRVQLVALLSGLWNRIQGRSHSDPEQKLLGEAKREDFLHKLGTDILQGYASVLPKKIIQDPFLLGDLLYRYALVVGTNAVLNTINFSVKTGMFAVPGVKDAPWALAINAFPMMSFQAEYRARQMDKTQKVDDTPAFTPAETLDELLSRIPRMFAGKQGWLYETWGNLTGFFAQMWLEFPVYLVVLEAYHGLLTGQLDPLTWEGWQGGANMAAGFLGPFGVYLIVKMSSWDRTIDLTGIRQWRASVRHKYHRLAVSKAKTYGIPIKTQRALDPVSGEIVQLEELAWEGLMLRQFGECFLPDKPNQTAEQTAARLTFKDFYNHYRTGAWKKKFAQWRIDRARFKQFHQDPEIVALSPLAKKVFGQWGAEFAYRWGNILFDTMIAILLAQMAGNPGAAEEGGLPAIPSESGG